jgi:Protein of unknown function (DUF4232)
MTLPSRRVPRGRAFCALLTVVICGLALTVPSGALAAVPCTGGNLHLSVHSHATHSDNTSWVLAFTNTHHQQCVLDGYPRTELLDSHHHSILPGLVTHKHHVLYGPVVLHQHRAAYVTFSLFHGPTCRAPSYNIYSVEFLGSPNLRLHTGKTSMCYAQVWPFRETARQTGG